MWTVALSDDEQEQHTVGEIVDLYAAGSIDADTFVWREGMDDWQTPFEVAELKVALIARGLTPRGSDAGGPPNEALSPSVRSRQAPSHAKAPAPPDAIAQRARAPAAAPKAAEDSLSRSLQQPSPAAAPASARARAGNDGGLDEDWLRVFDRPSLADFSVALESPRPPRSEPPPRSAGAARPMASPGASSGPPAASSKGRSAGPPPPLVKPTAASSRPAPPRSRGAGSGRGDSSAPPSRGRRGNSSAPPPRPKRGAPRSPAPRGSQGSSLDIEVDIDAVPVQGFGVRGPQTDSKALSRAPLGAPDLASLAPPHKESWAPRVGLFLLTILLLLLVVTLAVAVTRRPPSLYRVYTKVFGPVEALMQGR